MPELASPATSATATSSGQHLIKIYPLFMQKAAKLFSRLTGKN
jgi:hypothetical protein